MNCKQWFLLLVALVPLLASTGCQEEITLDLSNGDKPRIVIEALLWDDHGDGLPVPARVLVSRTGDVFNPLSIKYVDNATVVIFDDVDQRDTLTFIPIPDSLGITPFPGMGIYAGIGIQPIPGRTYTCQVTVEGTTYTATYHLREPARLDSLSLTYRQQQAFIQEGWYVKLNGRDPAGLGDYYFIRYTLNDTLKDLPSEINIQDDRFIDGNYIDGELFAPAFKSGDTIVVEFHHTNQIVFDHYAAYISLSFGTGGPFSGPGANPPSGFDHDALGVFWVSMPQRLGVRIP
jgi:hypothetical protein